MEASHALRRTRGKIQQFSGAARGRSLSLHRRSTCVEWGSRLGLLPCAL